MEKKGSIKVYDYNDIVNASIPVSEFYNWAGEVMAIANDCILPQKTRIHFTTEEYIHFLPCALPTQGILGVKVASRSVLRKNNGGFSVDADIMLYSQDKFRLLSVMDGAFITQARTAAIAVYTMLKVVKRYDVIAMVGLGGIGNIIGEILFEKIKDKNVIVKLMQHKDHAENFVNKFSEYSNITFEIVDCYENLMKDSDVVISSVNYIENDYCDPSIYKKGCTVIPVHMRGFMECDHEFDHIITSDLENVKNFKYYDRFKKLTSWDDIQSGKVKPRENENDRVLMYNSGLGIFDLYFANKIYQYLLNN